MEEPCTCENCTKKIQRRNNIERHIAHSRKKLETNLKKYNLEIEEVPSDGNCFFHAISNFLNDDITHETVRALICDYIENNPEIFKADIECDFPSVENYLQKMRKPGEWGDAIMANAFCLAYNVNIVIFSPDGISELYPGPGRPKMGVVRMGNHYCNASPAKSFEKTKQ